MNEQHAQKAMMQHMLHRVNEFLDENKVEEFENDEQLSFAFSRFLRMKEKRNFALKTAPGGGTAQEAYLEDVVDEHSTTIAFLKMIDTGRIGLLWCPLLFCNPGLPMPEEVRTAIVETLRFHANALESRAIDREMAKVAPKMPGDA